MFSGMHEVSQDVAKFLAVLEEPVCLKESVLDEFLLDLSSRNIEYNRELAISQLLDRGWITREEFAITLIIPTANIRAVMTPEDMTRYREAAIVLSERFSLSVEIQTTTLTGPAATSGTSAQPQLDRL